MALCQLHGYPCCVASLHHSVTLHADPACRVMAAPADVRPSLCADPDQGNGFVFDGVDEGSLNSALDRAISLHRSEPQLPKGMYAQLLASHAVHPAAPPAHGSALEVTADPQSHPCLSPGLEPAHSPPDRPGRTMSGGRLWPGATCRQTTPGTGAPRSTWSSTTASPDDLQAMLHCLVVAVRVPLRAQQVGSSSVDVEGLW